MLPVLRLLPPALLLAVLSLATAADQAPPAAGVRLHVSPVGNDAWSGTLAAPNPAKTDGPLASLARARDEIRRQKAAGAKGPFTVLVSAGAYLMTQTFTLGPEDSGTADAPVVYASGGAGSAVLIGGRKVAGFLPYKDKILKADVASQGLGSVSFRQLFFAGRRQHLARHPNYDPQNPYTGGWAYVEGKPVQLWATLPGENGHTLRMKPQDLRNWAKPEVAEVLIFPRYNWWNDIIRVASLDRQTRTLTLAGNASYEIRPGDRYFVRNVFEELDAPGEWYLDRQTATLYFWPPADLVGGDVYVPTLQTIVAIHDAAHVTLQGFTIECCEGTAVQLRGTTDCRVAACTIRNVGGQCSHAVAAVAVDGGRRNGVVGNDIYEVGSHAVTLSGGDRKTLTPAENFAENNYIHHTGVFYKQGVGVDLSGVGNRASHNLIHDCPRFAFLFSGNDQVIEYNHARHVDLETADTGAIYSGGRDWLTPRGSVIRYNLFHDIYGYGMEDGHWVSPHYAWGIYLDDNTAEVHVVGNIVARAMRGLIHFHCARDNLVENNIFVDGALQQMEMNGWKDYSGFMDQMGPAYEEFIKLPAWKKYAGFQNGGHPKAAVPMGGNRFVRNILCYPKSDALLYRPNNLRYPSFECDYNCIWHFGQPLGVAVPSTPPEKQWDAWRSLGFDQRSTVADPRFVDAAKDDYRLKPDSPALKLGFKPIPVEEIGPYPSPLRASWPIVEALGVRETGMRISAGKK
jgi:hypothetical protein